jgi:nucleotide-binding universal stress UspA family protein
MYRSILVPLDGSAFSEPAIAYAVEAARRSRGRVHLVHVLPGTGVPARSSVPPDMPREAEEWRREKEYLETVAGRVRREAGVPVFTYLARGPIAKTLESMADELGADLVVMTIHSHPGSGVASERLADRLLRSMKRPLLLFCPEAEPGESSDRRPLRWFEAVSSGYRPHTSARRWGVWP